MRPDQPETKESTKQNARYHLSYIFMLNHVCLYIHTHTYIFFFSAPSLSHSNFQKVKAVWILFFCYVLICTEEDCFLTPVEYKEATNKGTTLLLITTFKLLLQHTVLGVCTQTLCTLNMRRKLTYLKVTHPTVSNKKSFLFLLTDFSHPESRWLCFHPQNDLAYTPKLNSNICGSS